MFTDCGWEYLQDFVGYSYFRKPKAAMKKGGKMASSVTMSLG